MKKFNAIQKPKKERDYIFTAHPIALSKPNIPHVIIPRDLKMAVKKLQSNETLSLTVSGKCSNYLRCIESLANVQDIGYEHYFIIFKICLFLEQYQLDVNMKKYSLKNHNIKKIISDRCFILNVPSLDSDKPVLVAEDIITLQEITTKKWFRARIMNVVGNNVTAKLDDPVARELIDNQKKKQFDVNFHGNYWPFRCCHYALSLASKFNLLETIIYPQWTANHTDMKDNINWMNDNISKNKQQKQAVMKILQMTACPAPYIIFGPPGTGKTETLVEAICQIVEKDSRNYVLVCTASNAAADLITQRLIKYLAPEIIYRMYAPSRMRNTVKKEIWRCTNFLDNKVIFLPKEILMQKKIVISTLITSVRLTELKFRENHFSHIIIDEASQAKEPEMLIPITLTKNVRTEDVTNFQPQIVIAGDHYQLGPVVRSRTVENILGKSMLERLMNDFDQYKKKDGKYNPNYVTKLVKNYRSHEHIIHVSNKLFYEGDLEYCGGADTQIALNWKKLPNGEFPIIFQEVLGVEKRTSSYSVYNVAEALVVVEYVKMLIGAQFGAYEIKEKDIGIITPFKGQQLDIMQQLTAKGWGNVSVGTVDMFQGQERTVIIMSTARSKMFKHDDREHIGLLSNPKRFNVAMTRAKALLIIVGNPKIICTDKYWQAMWEYCKEHNGYVSFHRCPLSPKTIEHLTKCYETDTDINANETIGTDCNKISINLETDSTEKLESLTNVLVYTTKKSTK